MNHTDATRAMKLVLAKYGSYLPTSLSSSSRLSDVKSIFYFVDWAKFQSVFNTFYGSFFRAALGVTSTADEVDPKGVGAFVTPESLTDRVIYVKNEISGSGGKGHYFGNFATLTHEFIHFLSNEAFYPIFYSTGGAAPDQVEGATEMLTRCISTQIAAMRRTYNRQYQWYKSWAIDDTSGNFKAMANFVFNGTTAPLPNGNSLGLSGNVQAIWSWMTG
jgi:hypothetical protein